MNLKSSHHIWGTPGLIHRWMRVNYFKMPGYRYQTNVTYRHRDAAGRVKKNKPYEDRYIHHKDGRLRKLYVACTDDIFEAAGTSTWRRTYVRKVSSLGTRLATWVLDFSYEPDTWESFWVLLARSFPAAIAMQFVVSICPAHPLAIPCPPTALS
jgi:hypothetical protein